MLISTITTTYDTVDYIDECLSSITTSSHQDLEIVIVDDGSTDGTLDRLRMWQQRDDRITLHELPHLGRRAALDHAHRAATGDLHCWVDSDDIVDPEGIELVAQRIDAEHELAYSHRDVIDGHGTVLGLDRRNLIDYSPDQLLVDNMIFHLRMFTCDLYERSGGVGELESAIDWDMNLRMVEHTTPRCVPRNVYSYRIRDGRMTGRQDQHFDGRRAVESAIARRGLPYRLVTDGAGWHIRRVR